MTDAEQREQDIRASCVFYSAHPDHPDLQALPENGPLSRATVLDLMRVIIERVPKKRTSNARVVWLFNFLEGGSDVPRKMQFDHIAALTGKTPEAVRKICERHGS